MPFDAGWFKELRGLSEAVLAATPHEGRFRPRVGDLCHAGHVSDRFLEETQTFVRTMAGTPYGLDDFFRAYPRHVVNFPAGSAFRMQLARSAQMGKNGISH